MNLPGRDVLLTGLYLLLPYGMYGQATVFKSYKTQEAYCLDNPKMPTCIKTKPFNVEALNPGYRRPHALPHRRRLGPLQRQP